MQCIRTAWNKQNRSSVFSWVSTFHGSHMNLADFATAAFLNDPYPQYEKLRAEGPLVRVGPGVVVTGHYYIVDALLHDRRMGKDYLRSVQMRYGADAQQMPLFQGLSRMAP